MCPSGSIPGQSTNDVPVREFTWEKGIVPYGKSLNVFGILRRIIAYLRQYWPDTMIIVRGDSHFCSKELMDWAHDLPRVEFITGLSGNPALTECARVTIESAENEYNRYGKPVKRYHSFKYKAGSWSYAQRVVVKSVCQGENLKNQSTH